MSSSTTKESHGWDPNNLRELQVSLLSGSPGLWRAIWESAWNDPYPPNLGGWVPPLEDGICPSIGGFWRKMGEIGALGKLSSQINPNLWYGVCIAHTRTQATPLSGGIVGKVVYLDARTRDAIGGRSIESVAASREAQSWAILKHFNGQPPPLARTRVWPPLSGDSGSRCQNGRLP